MDLNTPYANILYPLSTEEYEALRADIVDLKNGVKVPIVIDEYNNILDGHHRYKIDPNAPTKTISGLSENKKLAYIYRSNLARRNLSQEQRGELRKRIKELARLLAKECDVPEIAALLGVPIPTIYYWINKKNANNYDAINICIPKDHRTKLDGKDVIAITERSKAGITHECIAADMGVTRQRVSQIIKKQAEIEKLRNPEPIEGELPISVTISTGDFREILKGMPDNSVDMIFTDPPYDKESIPLYGNMAEIAARILKPGASLITYVGHYAIGEVYKLMESHLKYFWTIAVKHSGNSARIEGKGIFVEWKPMMWWVKGKRGSKNCVADYIVSDIPSKKEHEWQQGYKEAEYYIEHLSNKGDYILDPFAGSGTTLIAAYRLGRKAIGVEKDESRANAARNRIQSECGQSNPQVA